MSKFRTSAESAQKVYDKILFWGPQFTGKTHTLLTWPGVALIDTENRGAHFGDRVDFLHAEAGSMEELAEVFKEIRAGSVPCETIGFDSYSATYDQLVALHTAKKSSGAFVTDYATVNKRIAAVRDFAFSIARKNVIFIAHAATKYDAKPDGKGGVSLSKKGVDFVGDPKFRYAFDYVFQLRPNGPDPRVSPATFIVEKSASPNFKIGEEIVGLTHSKFVERTRAHAPKAVEPRADDEEPVGPDEVEALESYAQQHRIPMMRLADLAKVASLNRTPMLKALKKGEARKLYRLLEREPKGSAA